MDEKKLKKDMRTLIRVITTNQSILEDLLCRIESAEEKIKKTEGKINKMEEKYDEKQNKMMFQ